MSPQTNCRGVRGATVVQNDTAEGVVEACAELFTLMMQSNNIASADIAAVVFTATTDLVAAFPAQAAEIAGFEQVPRICAQEIDVPGGLAKCLRILVLWNTSVAPQNITHSYTNGAEALAIAAAQTPSVLDAIEATLPED
ncbi:MAG: chorismate mutase [Planctomycetota bacterium]|nr:chorismate mutase [Planctomycetota bacterium]